MTQLRVFTVPTSFLARLCWSLLLLVSYGASPGQTDLVFVTMGMLIPGRSCSAEGVVRRAAVAVSSLVLGIARPRFCSVDVAIVCIAFAGIAAYHRTPIADAVVIAAAASSPRAHLAATVAAHALGRGPAWRYAIFGSAARGGRFAILAPFVPADRDAGRVVPALAVDGDTVVAGTARMLERSIPALAISIGLRAAVAPRPAIPERSAAQRRPVRRRG